MVMMIMMITMVKVDTSDQCGMVTKNDDEDHIGTTTFFTCPILFLCPTGHTQELKNQAISQELEVNKPSVDLILVMH